MQQRHGNGGGRGARRQADRHLTTQRLADVIDRQLRLLALAQDSARMGVENFTGFRWRDPSLGAYQQLLVHFTFQGRDLLAQGRLCDVQDFSGLGQTADIDDFHKIFQSS